MKPANQPAVLCIDDNDSGLRTRKLLLESKGFRVLTAGSGPAGLEIASRECVDLVILDYRMPGMDGQEVASRLRAQYPGIPILLLSGFPGLIPESLLLTVNGFVEKGRPSAVLVAEVERLALANGTPRDEEQARKQA